MPDTIEALPVEPVYTHCKLPVDSIELTGNERPPVSLDGQWWIIRRESVVNDLLAGFDESQATCLTLEEVIALKGDPAWQDQPPL